MPRDSSGNYTLPAGNPVVTGSTIASSWANTTLSDIATEITDSLDRSGKGGMLAAFRITDGTVSAPGIAFQSETGTGIYRVGAGQLGIATLGAQRVQIGPSGAITVTGTSITINGPAATQLNAFQFQQSGQSLWSIYQPASSSDFRINDGADRLIITTGGNLTIPAPSSGTTLTVAGVAANTPIIVNSANTSAQVNPDIVLNRVSTSANNVGQGVSIQMADTGGSTDSIIQHAGGQTEFWQFNGSWAQIARWTVSGHILQIPDQAGTMQDVGWRGCPPTQVGAANYTLALQDRGRMVNLNASGFTVTVPGNVFAAGDVVTISAISGVNSTIAAGTGMTLFWAGNGSTTGNRTLTGTGLATILFNNTNQGYISGAGLS